MTRRSWRPLLAPAVFLLAATIAVVVLRGVVHHPGHATSPPPAHGAHAQARRAPAPARPGAYTVRAGDTLSAIAARTGVPLARLRDLNPELRPTALFIGEKIRLR